MMSNSTTGDLTEKNESSEGVMFVMLSRMQPDDPAFSPICGFMVCSALMLAARDLVHASDETRQALNEYYEATDQYAMHMAHIVREHAPDVAETIQAARMTCTLTCMHHSPAAIALCRANGAGHQKTYIARSNASGLIKIGRSINPKARMLSLGTGAGCNPELLLVIDGDHERSLHRKFARLRVHGEWFSDDGSIMEYVLKRKRGDPFVDEEAM